MSEDIKKEQKYVNINGLLYFECKKCKTLINKSNVMVERDLCSRCWVELMREGVDFQYYCPETSILFDLYTYGSPESLVEYLLKYSFKREDLIKELKNLTQKKDGNYILNLYKKLKEVYTNAQINKINLTSVIIPPLEQIQIEKTIYLVDPAKKKENVAKKRQDTPEVSDFMTEPEVKSGVERKPITQIDIPVKKEIPVNPKDIVNVRFEDFNDAVLTLFQNTAKFTLDELRMIFAGKENQLKNALKELQLNSKIIEIEENVFELI